MKVVVTTESRFEMGPDGIPRCTSGTFDYRFWQRYLHSFDRVTVVARCKQTCKAAGQSVSGPGVTVWPLLDSQGAWGAVRRWRQWQNTLQPLLDERAAWILRVPGQIGGALATPLRRRAIPFAVEVVGDPASAFNRDSFHHPLRPWIQLFFRRLLRQACHNAIAASYVTREYLQQQYPAGPHCFVTDYSSVELPPEAFVGSPRNFTKLPTVPRLISVATMSQRYKGQHLLIEAVDKCRRMGQSLNLTLVGDGRFRADLEAQAARLGLSQQVRFPGQLRAGGEVRAALDQADIFGLASVGAEGLPRAIIEAQARALPCVGSRLCGIPELLGDSELTRPGDAQHLAEVITGLVKDVPRLNQVSAVNLQTANRYRASELRQRRIEFYEFVKRQTHSANHHPAHRKAA